MTTDRYQRIDAAVRRVLHRMQPATLERRRLPDRPEDQNLEGVMRGMRRDGASFALIAHEVMSLGGVPVTHETIRSWWHEIEAREQGEGEQ
jgi:hypothetical protein